MVEDTNGSVDMTLASDAFRSPDIDAFCGQFMAECNLDRSTVVLPHRLVRACIDMEITRFHPHFPHLHALKSDKSDVISKCLPFIKFI